jgi:hypothetical protein
MFEMQFSSQLCDGAQKYQGLVYLSSIFTFKRCEDKRKFGVHPILFNSLKYSFQKILYHGKEFLILSKNKLVWRKFVRISQIYPL